MTNKSIKKPSKDTGYSTETKPNDNKSTENKWNIIIGIATIILSVIINLIIFSYMFGKHSKAIESIENRQEKIEQEIKESREKIYCNEKEIYVLQQIRLQEKSNIQNQSK